IQGCLAYHEPDASHASSREGFSIQTRVSRRHFEDHPVGAQIRFQLADSLRAQGAGGRAKREPDRVSRSLGQLRQEQMESESAKEGAMGSADLGRDDDRVCRIHVGWSEPSAVKPVWFGLHGSGFNEETTGLA